MATSRYPPNDIRRQVGSPRPKGRENKDTLCRNVLIYGHCRYEDQGCAFNHDQNKPNNSGSQPDLNNRSGKKALNVDSPSFTPASIQQIAKKSTFSSQAASATPFTPKAASVTPSLQHNAEAPSFNPATVREFTPQNYDLADSISTNGVQHDTVYGVDHFSLGSMSQALPSATQYNPYAATEQNNHLTTASTPYFQPPAAFAGGPLQPPQYHLYAPIGPYREDLLPYQRATHDFFLSEERRIDLQKKAQATLQVLPGGSLPQLDRYHSLFPLDTTNRKNTAIFGYSSWAYKATSSKTGRYYCLRRLEGYRLTNENAIHAAREWKKISNANIVGFHEAFTTREFGDSSLIFAHDYFPLSKTLIEQHFANAQGNRYRGPTAIPENVLWGYICQLTNALRSIHAAKLAARCMDLSKIIVTDKNRIRLAACSILDVVEYGQNQKSTAELQQDDLLQFGKIILSLATLTHPIQAANLAGAVENLGNKYSSELRDAVSWLLMTPQPGEAPKTIGNFISGISDKLILYMDLSMTLNDSMTSELQRELENARMFRLACKLGTINERGEFAGDPSWSEHGDRYPVKLFRDYVFHQVDADGNPRVEFGHMVAALSKLDASSDERICLTSRDDQNVFIVSYRDVRQLVERSFNEIMKASKAGVRGV